MPEIGRFITEDPRTGTILSPNTMNPYVINNPFKYVDSLELSPCDGYLSYLKVEVTVNR